MEPSGGMIPLVTNGRLEMEFPQMTRRLPETFTSRMWLWIVFVLTGANAFSAEPYLEFIQALRDQQYHDFALIYLDQLATRPNVPPEIKQLIPHQKAMLLLDSSKTARSPEKQTEQLDQALAFLNQFVQDNPNHPVAADANSDRAQILLGKARVEILQSKSPANSGTKQEHQTLAREHISKAREVFQTAFNQHEAELKKFPILIEEQKEPQRYAARRRTEASVITAAYSLGLCTFEKAQTYDPGTFEFKENLNEAASEFEKTYMRYRTYISGLYARAWQGKCYEEQGEVQKAMGIYDELLDHPGEDTALSKLKAHALYFKLICLNSETRNDHQLVIDHATEWLKRNQNEARTPTGLGIKWELAKAHESLGDKADRENKGSGDSHWRQARTAAMDINRFPGEYKDLSLSMMQRLLVKLGGREKKPVDFDTAYGLARQSFVASQEIKKKIDAAARNRIPADELAKLKDEWNQELATAGSNFQLALSFVTPRDDAKSVANARLWYAYVNFWQHNNFEAAILAQYVAKTANRSEGTIALDAAYMSMAAFAQAYNDSKSPIEERSEEMRMVIRACNFITERWPGSDKANDARLMLGGLYSASKRPTDAAEWYGKIPETDPKYPEAQVAAGQAYWTAYLGAGRLTGDAKPSVEKLNEWLNLSQTFLRNGITRIAASLPKEGTAPAELIAAKMSLSQIVISQGKDADALKLLLDDPQSVIKAVSISDETKRPDKGVQSRKFAIETFKLLLRAYIGMGNIDKARETMNTLEAISSVGGTGGGADITELYIGLGRLLKDELERLRANGETDRFNKLMEAFETFLNDMSKRTEGQTFGSLSWIGETYFALGETVASDPGKSMSFYSQAGEAFKSILSKAEADANFASAEQLFGVKLRQVRVHRLKKEFEEADTLVTSCLKQQEKNINAHIAASEVYQDWGGSGQADGGKKLLMAIRGDPTTKAWGWWKISENLRKQRDFHTNPLYVEKFLDARHNGVLARHTYARDLGPKDKQKELERCLLELVSTASVTKDLSDERYNELNQMYREILQESGKAVENLPRKSDAPVEMTLKSKTKNNSSSNEPKSTDETDSNSTTSKPSKTATAPKPAAAKPPAKPNYLMWGLIWLVILAGLGTAGWFSFKDQLNPKRKRSSLNRETDITFGGLDSADARIEMPLGTPSSGSARPRQPSATAARTTSTKQGTRPGGPSAPEVSQPTKPRPKPPSPPKQDSQ